MSDAVDAVVGVARLLLAAVFAAAALGKLANVQRAREGLVGFGIPASLAGPGALLLPLVELAVAVALVPAATAGRGAAAALGLLVAFMAVISINLVLGRRPDCHCFGQMHSAPVGWPTLVRNGVLAGVAGFILAQSPQPAVLGWLGEVEAAGVVAFVVTVAVVAVVALQGWLALNLLRQNGRMLVRLDAVEAALRLAPDTPVAAPHVGLRLGSAAPGFALPDLDGDMVTLESLLAPGKPLMLVSTDPGCGPCKALFPDIGRWQTEHGAEVTIAVLSRKRPEDNRTLAAEHGVERVLLQKAYEVAEAYRVAGTPSGVVIGPDGTIASPVAGGADAVRHLLRQLLEGRFPAATPRPQAIAAPAVKPGDPAPPVRLPDLSGETVDLTERSGTEMLVLFWNPGCGFCQQMLPELKAWEARRPSHGPDLVLISTGTVEANQGMGLETTVLLDDGFQTGKAFAVRGTPSAVLIDSHGRIASEVAVGADAALALLQTSTTGEPQRTR